MARSNEIATEIAALLRARNPLLWIVTREEARVERYLFEAAASAAYITFWDVAQGVTDLAGKPVRFGSTDPGETLTAIATAAQSNRDIERCLWILRDLPPWLTGTVGITCCRQVRNLARLLPTVPLQRAALAVITPLPDIPPELAGQATLIEWPLPDHAEIAQLLDATIDTLPEELKDITTADGTRDAAIDAAIGLTGEEAQACIAKSLVQFRRIDPAAIAREKKRIIARERVLEWHDPLPGGLEAVGGLDQLKAWLISRKAAYTPQDAPTGCRRRVEH
jgi:hypothetical protein